MRFIEAIRSIDWVLTISALLLALVGLAMMISATYTEGFISPLFTRQAIAAAAAFALFLFLSSIPYHSIRRYTWIIYGAGIAGLLTVAAFGAVIRGTVSRITLFGVQLQPSEFMKIGLIIALAWVLGRNEHLTWKKVLLSAAITALPVAMVAIEPDLGVAALMLAVWAALLIFIGLPWKAVVGLGIVAALLFGAGWQWVFLDYQKDRLVTFLDPTQDPLGSGYNVVQSMVAIGSGQVLGRGLGHGPQSQLKFLPERHTDFILASIGEELGFLGVVLVLALYTTVMARIIKIAKTTQDSFGRLIAVGTFFTLLISLTVSAGMNMGILPVTGIPLPLVSFGGSNLVSTFALLGITQSVRVYSKWTQALPGEISTFG